MSRKPDAPHRIASRTPASGSGSACGRSDLKSQISDFKFQIQRSLLRSSSYGGQAAFSLRLSVLTGLLFLAAAVPAEAGNILRVGGSSSSGAASGAASGGVGSLIPASSPGAMAANNLLRRRTQALTDVLAMQNAARNITASSLTTHLFPEINLPSVPEGINPNGLDPIITSTTWTGAGNPVQSGSNDQPTVTITQTAQQAFLNWRTFNVGSHTTLNFDQSLGGANVANWIAFNQISASGVPSQILGKINAKGQVYVINPNGIIFGGSSQVNAHALVAAALPINTDLTTNGLLNNPNSEFLFSALPTGAFTPPPLAAGVYGDVEVQPGAQLNANPTADNTGGLVALIGPNVHNGGTIYTPYGQTILAAGYQVGLAAHPSGDPTLRGLDAYVGSVGPQDPNITTAQAAQLAGQPNGGVAENDDPDPTTGATDMGYIQSPYGDAMMVGQTVHQYGIIDSATSVSLNGRIDLTANFDSTQVTNGSGDYFNPSQAGSVVLGPGSVTQILPDMSAQTVPGTQLALPSLVNIMGSYIQLESDGTADNAAIILAPGATASNLSASAPAYAFSAFNSSNAVLPVSIPLVAGVSLSAGNWIKGAGNAAGYTFANPSGAVGTSITLDPYTTIDVSGSQNVPASVAEDIVPVQLLGAQLADSPLQRSGGLYRQTVNVDITQTGQFDGQYWAGTPLADTTGFINQIQRTVGELSANGGTVAVTAGNSVTLGTNSTINVSAGSINYAGGIVSTSEVVIGGHIMDISKATPDLPYSAIFTGTTTATDAKWGVTQTYTNAQLGSNRSGQYKPGYIQWGNAGSIVVTAPSMALNGNLFYGNTAEGPYQRTPLSQIVNEFGPTSILPTMASILAVPTAGALTLNFEDITSSATYGTSETAVAPSESDIIINQTGANSTTLSAPGASGPSTIVLSADLVNTNGFGNLTIYDPAGNIDVQSDLKFPESGGGGNGMNIEDANIGNGGGVVFGNIDNGLNTAGTSVTPNYENGGNIIFEAQNIQVDPGVGISAPSGTLGFTVDDVLPNLLNGGQSYTPLNPPPNGFNPSAGQFTLGTGATLSTAGLIVDDRTTTAGSGTQPLLTTGGTVAISAYKINLLSDPQNQSTIDVSGGVEMSATGQLKYGGAGGIALSGLDPSWSEFGLTPAPASYPGGISIAPTVILKGYSGATNAGSGGTLSLTAPFVQVGGSQLLNGDATGSTLWLNQTDPNGNLLAGTSDFFSQGGFSNFSLTGIGNFVTDSSGNVVPYAYMPALVIAPSTVIDPQVTNVVASTQNGALTLLQPNQPTLPGQRTPVSLTFVGLGNHSGGILSSTEAEELRGDLVVYPGARIETDPQLSGVGTVSLTADTVTLLGSVLNPDGTTNTAGAQIIAHGGNINLVGKAVDKYVSGVTTEPELFAIVSNSFNTAGEAPPTLDLGPGTVLDASGDVVTAPKIIGDKIYNTGTVLPGGAITLSGNIVIEGSVVDANNNPVIPAAELDVNGTSSATGQLYVPAAEAGVNAGRISGSNYVSILQDSNGGSIALEGSQELFVSPDASLEGAAGGALAQGGSLTVYSGNVDGGSSAAPNANLQPTEFTMLLTADGVPFSLSKQPAVTPTGQAVTINGLPVMAPVLGSPVTDSNDPHNKGGAYLDQANLNNGGFASLTLGTGADTLQFSGKVILGGSESPAIESLTIATTGMLLADPNPKVVSSLTLQAPYVALGQPLLIPGLSPALFPPGPTAVQVPPTSGSGSLNVIASDLIDLGTLTLQNIGVASFDATNGGQTNGSIRGAGALDVAGAVNLTAGQIYPPTATAFSIAAYNTNPLNNYSDNNVFVTVAKSFTSNNQVTLMNPAPAGFVIGSSLLGSTVTGISPDGLTVTLASDADANANNASEPYNYSSVTINPGPAGMALPALPLSAGGTLNIDAAVIAQNGVLRAPIGTINLGWNGVTAQPWTDPVGGKDSNGNPIPLPVTQTLTLGSGSVTSVSAVVDPATGQVLTIPYGVVQNGTDWYDPTGAKITATGNGAAGAGLPTGIINLGAANVTTANGSIVDLTGGGDLYAYRWVPGLGGNYDILNPAYNAHTQSYGIGVNSPLSAMSFAVIPTYSADYAPFAPNNISTSSSGVGPYSTTNPVFPTGAQQLLSSKLQYPQYVSDTGYTSYGLSAGEKIYLGASNGLPAGYYTLLPARYALLPGAFLVTPQSSFAVSAATASRPDGSSIVAGYMYNNLGPALTQPLYSSFEVDPQSVVRSRAEYDPSSANSFFVQSAQLNDIATPRLPVDAGQLVFNVANPLVNGPTSASFSGNVYVNSEASGLGGEIDINSPGAILIASSDQLAQTLQKSPGSTTGDLILDPAQLNGFGAASLLVGGVRASTTSGTTVTVAATSVEVNNGATTDPTSGVSNNDGKPLNGSDVILAANGSLTLDPGSVVSALGSPSISAEALQVGQPFTISSATPLSVRSGSAITFPNGGSLIASSVNGGTVTPPNGGTPVAFAGGLSGVTITPSPGSTVTFNSGGGNLLTSSTRLTVMIGDGALVRVSSDPSASIVRAGLTPSTSPTLAVGANATVTGASVTLDSTGTTRLGLGVALGGAGNLANSAINLNSNEIALQFFSSPTGPQPSPSTLVLPSSLLQDLQASSLSLLSYTSIDIYGNGNLALTGNLALHAGEIDDATDAPGDGVQFNASKIVLDNSANGTGSGFNSGPSGGTLTFNAGNTGMIELGANPLAINQYNNLTLIAGGGIVVQGAGGLATQGALAMQTPLLTGQSGASQTITAGGALTVQPLAGGSAATVSGGLGANLTLVGATIANTSSIALPSGILALTATNGGITIGDPNATSPTGELDVGGQPESFNGTTAYTGGGQITLTSAGNVNLEPYSMVDVSAAQLPGGSYIGNAGSLTISAPNGTLAVAANVLNGQGQGGLGGQEGTLSLDVGTLNSSDLPGNASLDSLAGLLGAADFTHSVSIRDRGDALITFDQGNTLTAHTVNLSADQGSIDIFGTIDASGLTAVNVSAPPPTNGVINWDEQTGGSISLSAFGNVTLESGSKLLAGGAYYNDAGQGGSISILAGAYNANKSGLMDANGHTVLNGTGFVNNGSAGAVDIKGATIDLAVLNPYTTSDISAYWTSLINQYTAGSPAPGAGPVNSDPASLPGYSSGQMGGTLLLCAPQIVPATPSSAPGVAIDQVGGNITGASSIVVEGYKVYTPTNGVIDTIDAAPTTDANGNPLSGGGIVYTDAQTFVTTTNINAFDALFPSSVPVANIQVEPGAEIVNAATPAPVPVSTTGSTLAAGAGLATGTVATTTANIPGNNLAQVNSGTVLTVALDASGTTVGSNSLTIKSGTATAVLPEGTGIAGSSTNNQMKLTNSLGATIQGSLTLDSAGTIKIAAGTHGTYTLPGTTTPVNLTAGQATFLPFGATVTFSGAFSLTAAVAGGPSPVATLTNLVSGTTITLTPTNKNTIAGNSVVSTPIVISGGTSYTIGTNNIVTNSTGNLALYNTWDLSTFRFGPNADSISNNASVYTPVGIPNGDGSGEPGVLTLRAAGNLVFNYNPSSNTSASLTDGFDTSTLSSSFLGNGAYLAANTVIDTNIIEPDGTSPSIGGIGALDPASPIWTAQLMPPTAPGSSQPETLSWSYNLTAGADLSAADCSQVMPLTASSPLATTTGSIQLGYGAPALSTTSLTNKVDLPIISQYYETIRTGVGNINMFAGQDVQLLNPLATIYTAGSQVLPLQGGLPSGALFDVPGYLPGYVPGYANGVYSPEIPVPFSPYLTTVVPPNSVASGSGSHTTYTPAFFYPAQYSQNGGNVAISAQDDIVHELFTPSTNTTTLYSSEELPTNWLYRRGYVNANQFAPTNALNGNTEIASTTWWVDFSNFFEGVGVLGGGDVTLAAGRDVANVDAVAPTNARVSYGIQNNGNIDSTAADQVQAMAELGGGDVAVTAGNNINGGNYYVERGQGVLSAGNQILTNDTRSTFSPPPTPSSTPSVQYLNPTNWLPTTLFLGDGSFDISADNSVLLGPVANTFLLPQGINNGYFDTSFFSTYATTDAVAVSSLAGNVTIHDASAKAGAEDGSLMAWYTYNQNTFGVSSQPWLGLAQSATASNLGSFDPVAALLPGTLQATAYSGSLNLVGGLTLSPSPDGTLDLAAAGSINGFQPVSNTSSNALIPPTWAYSEILLSDANPNNLPGLANPLSLTPPSVLLTASNQENKWVTGANDAVPLASVAVFFNQSGATTGPTAALQTEEILHGASRSASTGLAGPLHVNDASGPIEIDAETSDISGLELFAGKAAQVVAGTDITDIAFYLQNDNASDVSVVDAGRDIIAYDANSPLRGIYTNEFKQANIQPSLPTSETGDIQVAGPGTLEVLAGRNLTLGSSPTPANNGLSTGITSIGGTLNPALPFAGADVVAGAGLGSAAPGLGGGGSQIGFTAFIDQFLTPTSSYWSSLLPELQILLPSPISVTGAKVDLSAGLPAVWPELTQSEQKLLAPQILNTFYLVLRDAGRNHPKTGNFNSGFSAISALFPGNVAWQGDLTLTSREIKTENGGNIDILAPGGQLTVGLPVNSGSPADQGILTDDGGNISIFTNGNVTVGVSRIFTLLGGNEVIWSSTGNIAAGSASKTVSAAPPTRVLVDPTSASVKTDLSGLATGGGIGVLASVPGVAPGDVDLIAPNGFVDAGDAGIRASGNLNISAVQVLNASNISVGGKSTGTPAPPAAPNIGSIASASNTSAASSNAAAEVAKQGHAPVQQAAFPSIITVEVLGYGGGDS
jgi:filamentous hemagglutinin